VFKETIGGVELTFETDAAVFSPGRVDSGTLAMISQTALSPSDKLLDLGCGYGAVGIYAAKIIGDGNVTMSDIDARCISLAKSNAAQNGVAGVLVCESDCFDGIIERGFTVIMSNPPYHSDFSVPKRFVEKGFNRLAVGGRLVMVTKRREWYKNKLISIFGGVAIAESNGYFVFTAEKRNDRYANVKNEKS